MIRKATVILAVSAFCLMSNAAHAFPPSGPQITGQLTGLEYTTQALSGKAGFVGTFFGSVDGHLAFGAWSVSANHDPLPDNTGGTANMVGEWELEVYVLKGFWFQKKTFGGTLSGVLTNRGDNDLPVDNFDMLGKLIESSTGTVYGIQGILYHDTFPPTVKIQMGSIA